MRFNCQQRWRKHLEEAAKAARLCKRMRNAGNHRDSPRKAQWMPGTESTSSIASKHSFVSTWIHTCWSRAKCERAKRWAFAHAIGCRSICAQSCTVQSTIESLWHDEKYLPTAPLSPCLHRAGSWRGRRGPPPCGRRRAPGSIRLHSIRFTQALMHMRIGAIKRQHAEQ